MLRMNHLADSAAWSVQDMPPDRVPQIGDLFPDLWVDSTDGDMQFHAWARGYYTVLFSHAAAYSDVSESDIVSLARARPEFEGRGARLVGLTLSDPQTERMWIDDLSERAGIEIAFPVISDEEERVHRICDLARDTACVPVGKTIIIGPDLRICAVFAYPAPVPRSVPEILRVIDALRASGSEG